MEDRENSIVKADGINNCGNCAKTSDDGVVLGCNNWCCDVSKDEFCDKRDPIVKRMSTEEWNEERIVLERNLDNSIDELCAHMGCRSIHGETMKTKIKFTIGNNAL